jgi:hypothetical protein
MRRRSAWRALAATAALLAFAPAAQARAPKPAPRVLYYNQGNGLATESTFGFKVLQLTLEKSGVRYELRPSPLGRVTEPRAIEAISAGDHMDVAMLGTSAHADAHLTPVRIPIDRGLLGYRIFLIDGARQADFDAIRDRKDLSRISTLQGKGWPDVAILRNAGVTVWTGVYERLFAMILADRGDAYPRGVLEAHGEVEKHKGELPGLAVEKRLALHYRFTSFFYVAKNNTVLRDQLYRGLERAFADGSYDRLFNSDPNIRRSLAQADLRHRRIIEMDNPFLSAETRAIPERYWWRP